MAKNFFFFAKDGKTLINIAAKDFNAPSKIALQEEWKSKFTQFKKNENLTFCYKDILPSKI